jgi:NAD(P)-dependent dehydrogenase (short-subunit alcohol dehydrogenase family)
MNTIGPGITDTPILDDTSKKLGQEHMAAFPKPLGRIATPVEQAWALMFLNSNAATFVTGSNLWVDGGYEAGVATDQFPSWYD